MRKLFLMRFKEKIIDKKQKYLTIEEKKELILEGKDVPVCVNNSKSPRLTFGIAPERRFIPGKTKNSKKRIKL